MQDIKVVHRGNADYRFRSQLTVELKRYADGVASEDENRIIAAKKVVLGADKEQVLNALFKALRGTLSQKLIESSYDRAVADSDYDRTIDPNTCWGMVQGMTAHSQTLPYADERTKIDIAAGKLLQMAF